MGRGWFLRAPTVIQHSAIVLLTFQELKGKGNRENATLMEEVEAEGEHRVQRLLEILAIEESSVLCIFQYGSR